MANHFHISMDMERKLMDMSMTSPVEFNSKKWNCIHNIIPEIYSFSIELSKTKMTIIGAVVIVFILSLKLPDHVALLHFIPRNPFFLDDCPGRAVCNWTCEEYRVYCAKHFIYIKVVKLFVKIIRTFTASLWRYSTCEAPIFYHTVISTKCHYWLP